MYFELERARGQLLDPGALTSRVVCRFVGDWSLFLWVDGALEDYKPSPDYTQTAKQRVLLICHIPAYPWLVTFLLWRGVACFLYIFRQRLNKPLNAFSFPRRFQGKNNVVSLILDQVPCGIGFRSNRVTVC